jgi:hypothetical protein
VAVAEVPEPRTWTRLSKLGHDVGAGHASDDGAPVGPAAEPMPMEPPDDGKPQANVAVVPGAVTDF